MVILQFSPVRDIVCIWHTRIENKPSSNDRNQYDIVFSIIV